MIKRIVLLSLLLSLSLATSAAEHVHGSIEKGPLFKQSQAPSIERLPTCRLKAQLEKLPAKARAHALRRMKEYGIGEHDLTCLHADQDGEMFFQCSDVPDEVIEDAAAEPLDAGASTMWDSGFTPSGPVNVDSPPVFNSKPGATNVAYLDFNGDTITGTAWNNHSIGSPTINARPFDIDADQTTFSNTEQTRIYQVWQRVAEDLAAFDINVTTDPFYDDQDNRGPTVGQILISHNGDFNNDNAGGRAYVGVFGYSNYATYYSPALVYYNKLSSRADYIAEAASHEFGHNLGLNHDGTSSKSYYNGHGSGVTSWGPIMGTGYNRNVSQWSNGEYYDANSSQDDEARIISKLGYRADDHADSIGAASALQISSGTTIENTHADNRGIIMGPHDPDVFKFATEAGAITLRVDPFVVGSQTKGGNLDVKIRLLDGSGNEVAVDDNSSRTYAEISTSVSAGTYYLEVTGVGWGTPLVASPTGYVDRFSQGQFFISGTIVAPATDLTAPTASVAVSDISTAAGSTHDIVITYSDDTAVDVSTLSSQDVRVTGPNSYNELASFISVDVNSDGNPRVATYRINAPGGSWDYADNGDYEVAIEDGEIVDTNNNKVPADTYESFTVNIPSPPEITSSLTASGTQSSWFSYYITADHSPTSYSSGTLPSGLSLNSSSGRISGTPTTAGTYNVTITATNALGSDSETLVITINPARPVITSSLTANGTQGVAFNYAITASNNPTSYGANNLPPGLSVNTSTGLISGTPTSTGSTNVTITATNAGGSGSATLAINIGAVDTVDPSTTSVSVIVKGTVSTDTTSLTLNGVSTSVDASGNYEASVVVTPGASTITIIATDGAGNQTTRTIDVTSAATIPPVSN